jgi:hypothetical protein
VSENHSPLQQQAKTKPLGSFDAVSKPDTANPMQHHSQPHNRYKRQAGSYQLRIQNIAGYLQTIASEASELIGDGRGDSGRRNPQVMIRFDDGRVAGYLRVWLAMFLAPPGTRILLFLRSGKAPKFCFSVVVAMPFDLQGTRVSMLSVFGK